MLREKSGVAGAAERDCGSAAFLLDCLSELGVGGHMKVPHQTLRVINSALFLVHIHHFTPAEFTEEFVEECKCQVFKAKYQEVKRSSVTC